MLDIAIYVVIGLISVTAAVSVVTSIVLWVKYVKFNKKQNSAGLTAEETARKILDANGLQDIKVKSVGSLMFGNSYSHYFKKVRIRRLTRHKTSVTALAMGSEKAALAVLDKEGDPDMKARIRLTPFMYLGPIAFIPLIAIGLIVDIVFFSDVGGLATIITAGLSVIIYLISFVLCVFTLKTEKKAQVRACEILKENKMATDEELDDMKELFKLYNIQYINDLILAMLELILRVLQVVSSASSSSSSGSGN